jgi:hypothetical protein
MTSLQRPRHASVQFADPTAPSGIEVSRKEFLVQCRQSAMARFRAHEPSLLGCRTVEHPVPALPGSQGSTGMIAAHLSPAVCRAWEATVSGSLGEKRAHVEEQVHLALKDLADQDMHGYLALTDAQCALFDPDLVQLVTESLDRTTFSRLGRRPDPHWEGTLVERVRPPYLVLIVSVGFEKAARRRPGGKPVVAVRRPRRDGEDGFADPDDGDLAA